MVGLTHNHQRLHVIADAAYWERRAAMVREVDAFHVRDLDIARAHERGEGADSLARRFGLDRSMIYRILKAQQGIA